MSTTTFASEVNELLKLDISDDLNNAREDFKDTSYERSFKRLQQRYLNFIHATFYGNFSGDDGRSIFDVNNRFIEEFHQLQEALKEPKKTSESPKQKLIHTATKPPAPKIDSISPESEMVKVTTSTGNFSIAADVVEFIKSHYTAESLAPKEDIPEKSEASNDNNLSLSDTVNPDQWTITATNVYEVYEQSTSMEETEAPKVDWLGSTHLDVEIQEPQEGEEEDDTNETP